MAVVEQGGPEVLRAMKRVADKEALLQFLLLVYDFCLSFFCYFFRLFFLSFFLPCFLSLFPCKYRIVLYVRSSESSRYQRRRSGNWQCSSSGDEWSRSRRSAVGQQRLGTSSRSSWGSSIGEVCVIVIVIVSDGTALGTTGGAWPLV